MAAEEAKVEAARIKAAAEAAEAEATAGAAEIEEEEEESGEGSESDEEEVEEAKGSIKEGAKGDKNSRKVDFDATPIKAAKGAGGDKGGTSEGSGESGDDSV